MLEVCVDQLESAIAASDGGASRIELCSALCDGGLTPSVGFLEVVKRECPNLTVFAMLRPRGGADFHYSDLEMECILSDLQHLRAARADGFVFGALNPDRSIDQRNCRRVIEAASPLPVTFHRAFDLTIPSALMDNFRLVHGLGFKRLLTSGLAANAFEGLSTISRLNAATEGPIVMPGAGITVENAGQILKQSGCTEFHGSGRESGGSKDMAKCLINGIDFGVSKASDRDTVRQLVIIGKLALSEKH